MEQDSDEISAGLAKVQWALAILREHYDCGLLLLSRDLSDGGTGRVFMGYGNTFGQAGMARAFLRGRHEDEEPDLRLRAE